MMKNKKLTYLLIVVVVSLWGFILYKIFYSKSKESSYMTSIKDITTVNKHTDTDSFIISVNYRDPFLDNRTTVKRNISTKKTNIKRETKQPKPQIIPVQVIWPTVQFNGIISNKNKKLGMIKINGEDFLMKEGDQLTGVQVVKLAKDSIIVAFQNEKKTVRK